MDPIILGEIRFGIYLLPAGKRRRRLEQWFSEGVAKLTCLPWTVETGLRWAKLLADPGVQRGEVDRVRRGPQRIAILARRSEKKLTGAKLRPSCVSRSIQARLYF